MSANRSRLVENWGNNTTYKGSGNPRSNW